MFRQELPLQNNFAERLHQMYFIRTGFVFNAIFTGIKPFIHEATKAKFKFFTNNYLEDFLNNFEEDQIPRDYGGTGPSLDDLTI